ncbi:MAG: (2Fe-2S) ferredoxin domain-containing protein [Desulfarculus sp.]|nr:(2Fe-2S) ferredoxin domain-containing protein [Desulfarculus sp.]MBI5524570.1 (2Fe-2S) ferredoxin domain-containing protein [Desulfarculus sp.]
MAKLKISDLAKIKEQVTASTSLREGGASVKVTVHMGTCGIASGARTVLNAVMDELEKSARKDVIITTSGCMGLCSAEPLVTVEKLGEEPIKYSYVDDPKMRQIFNRHVLEGEIQTQWVLAKGSEQ